MKIFFNLERSQLILKMAAWYNILWGAVITFLPRALLSFFDVDIRTGMEFWQFFGMIVGVTGIGYYIASLDTGKFWPIVFVGFLGHLMATFVFSKALLTVSLPTSFSLILVVSSFVWVIPFYYILLLAYEENTQELSAPKHFHDLISFVRTSQNKTLYELSNEKNVLLILVRHLGCTFCKETVSEMAKIEGALSGKNLTPVFVHMSDPGYGDEFFSNYYSHPVHHISDPTRALYKSLNLKRGTFYQLFGPMTWIRGIYTAFFKGHRLGGFEGDILQLGGIFILSKGQVIFEEKALSASHLFHLNALPEL